MFELEKDLWKKLLAEFVGTFIFAAAVIFPSIALREAGLGAFLFIMFTAGVGLTVAVWLFRDVSGGHVNPVVTFGMMLLAKMKVFTGVLYWIAQLAGATVAAYYAIATFKLDTGSAQELGNYGMAMPVQGYKDYQVVLAEAIGAFLLVSVVYAAMAVKEKVYAGIMIGAALLLGIVMVAPVSGGALNPAREFAPMLLAKGFKSAYVWDYIVGPFAGAAAAAIVYYLFSAEKLNLRMPSRAKTTVKRK